MRSPDLRRWLPAFACGLLVLGACGGNQPGSASPSLGGTQSGRPQASGSQASRPASTAPPLPTGPDALKLVRVGGGLRAPTGIANAGDGSGRLYINEQAGVVRVVDASGTLLRRPFIDLSDRISSGGERGLLGLAFDPGFERNHRFFVNYTDRDGNTVISELRAADDGLSADPRSERVLLHVTQPYANHNGGQLAFGPDGYLYIGLGDGGSGGDPHGNGQNRNVLLGKILRIDVHAPPSGGRAYATPADNPFAGGGGAPEVWAYGLRNPWRFSFDAQTGDLYIADVGQGAWEEIDRQPSDSSGGENYGWNVMEGRHCYASDTCDQRPFVKPIAEYSHEAGRCSVTGGYVYRGSAQPKLDGVYIFADYCSGTLFTLQVDEGTITPKVVAQTGLAISSFGVSEDGELYAVDLAGGGLYRVVVS